MSVVYVVDDDAAVRDSLRWLLESVNMPVRTFANAADFLADFEPDEPGCVVLDVRMPGMSGLELQEHLLATTQFIPIIFISGHGDIAMAVRTIQSGAVDFIEKPFGDQELLDRIHRALEMSEERISERNRRADLAARLARLTSRERQVLKLIGAGRANKMIAAALDLAEKTIEAHRTNLNRKLGATSVADLVRIAIEAESLLPPPAAGSNGPASPRNTN